MALAWLMALALLASDGLAAQPQVGLGTADSFAVLAGSTVTNTGPSTVNGDLGVSPGGAPPVVTGFFPPGTVNGTIHDRDAVAGQAQSALTTAYNDAAGRTPATTVSGDLAGLTLTAGVYRGSPSLGLTGDLTLDAGGDPNAVFIFQAPSSTLTTASGSRVNLINGAQACNVFWQIGSSATLGGSTGGSSFIGNILALTSITINNGVTVGGRALARNGAVTLDNDTITAAHCAPGTTGGGAPGGGTPGGGTPGGGTPGGGTPSGGTTGGGTSGGGTTAGHNGTAVFTTVPRRVAKTVARYGTSRCVGGTFRAAVSGLFIRRVVFSLGGHVIATRRKSPFEALVRTSGGIHTVRARITFSDGTPAATVRLRFRSCAPAKSRVPRRPAGFTG